MQDVDELVELASRFPDDPYLLDLLGDATQLVDHPSLDRDYSLRCYLQAIDRDPTYWPAYKSLGHWFDISEEFLKARLYFELAIEHGAGDRARIALASVLAQMGNKPMAFATLDQCDDNEDLDVTVMRDEIVDGLHDPYTKNDSDTPNCGEP
ncbi:tetratricopeptide repeat protein [Rosistilla oblonga]|uniref:tetratricopeptide repeat protein n=1 Tax=Rosistilla oblonga TaxID=2527990 RepID=UPI003A97A973